ncbi:MAG: DMT family transporter [Deltaproteobacteria bacterium]|jgi:drug/metabolite transporter (DMT)-like permease|nr:DMT family transporter [Deltaproteobacteria bacterium]
MNNNKNVGLLLAIASPLFFAAFDVGLRLVTADISVLGLVFIRGWVGLLIVWALISVGKQRLVFLRLRLLTVIGTITTLGSLGVATSITMIPLYQAVVILYLYPALTVVLGRLINAEVITPRTLILVLAAFIGCILLVWPDKTIGLEIRWAHGLALGGALCYALAFVLVKRLGQASGGLEPFFFFSLTGLLVAVLFSLLTGVGFGIDNLTEVFKGSALALLGALAQLTAYAALKYLPPFKVGVIGTLEILCATLASWLMFSDPLTIRAVIGGAMILTAVIGFQKRTKKVEEVCLGEL